MFDSANWAHNRFSWTLVGVIALAFASAVTAKDDEAGPRVGASLSPFDVVKCGGAEDGIEVGETLCYRSRNGIRPQVIVFARAGDKLKKITELTKQLDAWVAESKNNRAFVSVLGDSVDDAKEAATQFAESLELKAVPVAVPSAVKSGPETYSISKDQQVTVLVVKRGRIRAVVQDSGDMDAAALAKAVMDSVKESL